MAKQNEVEIRFTGNSKNLTNAIKQLDTATKKLINTQAKIVNFNKKNQQSNEKNKNSVKLLRHELRLKGKTLKDLNAPLHIYRQALSGNSLALGILRKNTNLYISSLGKSTSKTKLQTQGLFKLGHAARQTGGAFSVLRSKLLLFNFAMTLGIRQLLIFAKEAANVEALGTAFATLSGGGEKAGLALEKLQKATNGTVSSMDLFQQANNAMILGVTKNSDEMATMFDMAQRLGRALGRDARSSIESFVTGVGRQSRLMLDNIGLIVKSEVAYKAYAIQLNKNVKDLDEVERKQAFLNAAIVAGEEALRNIGSETLSSADKLQRMSTELIEVRQQIGDELLPVVLETSEAIRDFAKTIDSESIRSGIATVKSLTAIFLSYKTVALGVAAGLKLVAFIGGTTLVALAALGGVISLAVIALGSFGIALQRTFKQQADYEAKIRDVKIAHEDATKAIRDHDTMLRNFEQNSLNAVAQIQASEAVFLESSSNIFNNFDKWLTKIGQSEEELNRIRKEESERAKNYNDITQGMTEEQIEQYKPYINAINKFHMIKFQLTEEDRRLEKEEVLRLKALAKTREILSKVDKSEREEKHKSKQHDLAEEKARVEQLIALIQKEIDKEGEAFEALENLHNLRNDINNQAQLKMKGDLQKKIDLEAEVFARIEELRQEDLEKEKAANATKIQLSQALLSSFNSVVGELNNLMTVRMNNDIQKMRASTEFNEASLEKRQSMEQSVMRKHSEAQRNMFLINKVARLADIAINTATAITGLAAIPLGAGLPLIPFVKAMGVLQAGIVAATPPPPTFEQGGLIGGQRHSQGGTIIEAERGEFVMSRNAVQSIGLENLNNMNQGSGGGITLNISAPLVDETVIDTIIPAIQKAQRMNLA